MANNYTNFSEMLELENEEQVDWCNRELKGALDREDAPADLQSEEWQKWLEGWCKERDIAEQEADYWPGFEWQVERGANGKPTGLWIHDNGEGGNLEMLAAFVQMFLNKFRPKDCWSLTWADFCSKPRIGEFGGGGMFVTAEGVEWMNAYSFVANLEAEHRNKTKKKGKVKK